VHLNLPDVWPTATSGNRHWKTLKGEEPVFEHLFKKCNSCYVDAAGAVFDWSSFDAREAQNALSRRASATRLAWETKLSFLRQLVEKYG